MNDFILRFALGGVAVSVFSACAEVLKPKTFSGILGGAPAVALVSLALTFAQRGNGVVRQHGLGMVCGAIAFFVYACACVFTTANTRLPVWLGAAVCWVLWLLVAVTAWVTVKPS